MNKSSDTPGQNNLRVAQVLAGAPRGGAENFFTRLVCALAETGTLAQRVFTRPNAEREAPMRRAGLPVANYRFGSALHWLDHRRYRHALRDWRPDIVATYMNRATALTPRGDYQLVARLGHYYDLKYYRHCDYWIGIAQGICDHMVRGGLPAERIVHIPNFIDETPAPALARDSFDTPADQPLLLALGRLHTNKGFDVLLRALPAIDNATLWLAGEGPEESALRALAEELGVTGRVRFLGWRTDVNALMQTADVFVCPSRHEGLGSIVGEAWFNHCPIVATRSQGPGELIEHGATGLLTAIDDHRELAAGINELLHAPAEAQALAAAAHSHYQRHYSKKIIVQQYLDFYQSIQAAR